MTTKATDTHNPAPATEPLALRLSEGLGDVSEAREMNRAKERNFAKKLSKAGWHTYTDEETGRVVTNAHDHEVPKLAKISGMPCEVVSAGWDGGCARVGPVLGA